VETVRRFGRKVYYGDASRIDLLRAAKADTAKLFVLAIDDESRSRLRNGATELPDPIYARARAASTTTACGTWAAT
jgi:glutathione-regulated potassium-efflux system ancillary protein KefC/glutathione-regulated potassium-efflux system protein KefB